MKWSFSMKKPPALSDVEDIASQITAFTNVASFPESLDAAILKYREGVEIFASEVLHSEDSAKLLEKIREHFGTEVRMTLLKIFRRCVSPVCDTEMTKKVRTIPTSRIVENFGSTFKSIDVLKAQFKLPMDEARVVSLCSLLAESDGRGQSGYALTSQFFDWFNAQECYADLEALGPRGAGRDIELNTLLSDFPLGYPCDLVICDRKTREIQAVGFARYDATRGGSQSDDRTGGNANKVQKALKYQQETGKSFRLIFLSDGPGLLHRDTLEESMQLDGQMDGAVRVTTLKLAPSRLTPAWLKGLPE
jgi:hypothetical protein